MRPYLVGRLSNHRVRGVVCVVTFILTAFWSAAPVVAGCTRGPVACTTAAGYKTCTATVRCIPGYYNPTWRLAVIASQNVVSCDPTASTLTHPNATFNLVARARTTAPLTRSCLWQPDSPSRYSVDAVSIQTSDGLPVELMDFSIDE